MPLYGFVDQISRSMVVGWAVHTDHPGGQTWLSIHCNGVHRGTCLTQHHRPGVPLPNGETAPENCGFHFVFDPPLSAFDEQRIEVLEIWSGETLENGRRVLPQPSPADRRDGWTPVILTSTGRSATTLLMSEFARHPELVVADRYPYEVKHIAYYSAAFRALVAEADREHSTHPDTMLSPERRQIIGSNPYNDPGLFNIATPETLLQDFYERTVPSCYAGTFRDLIIKFYATLAGSQGKQAASIFCEKGDIDEAARRGARLFFAAVKEIVVVRDPRDLLCSAIAFWKLPQAEAMTMLQMTLSRLARIIRLAGPDTLVVRYEDLLLDPAGSRLALSKFIGVDRPLQVKEATGGLFEKHGTSGNPAASIGRWKQDLGADQIAACDAAFAGLMRDFDYYPGDAARWPGKPAGASRVRNGSGLVVAEGRSEVLAFLADIAEEDPESEAPQQLLSLTFGQGETGTGFLRDGWSAPEDGYVWSNGPECHVCLPAIRQSGQYCLHVVGDPFTHRTTLPVQRMTVLVNGQSIGEAQARDSSVIEVMVPPAAVAAGQAITLTLRLPDAARPADIVASKDLRRLGFALRRIILCRVATQTSTGARQLAMSAAAESKG